MFDNLIESKPKRQRSAGQTFLSLVVHGVLIAAAVFVTKHAADAAEDTTMDTTMVFLKPPEPEPPPPDQPPPEVVVAQNPPPKGFQTIAPPDIIPTEIPPVDLDEKPFDPRDFTGRGVEGGIAEGIVGGTGPVDLNAEVFLDAEVDDPIQILSQPNPRYPPALEMVGVTGRVVLEYIVGTNGKVEPSSIKVIEATNPQFVEPAKESVLKAVFKPAMYRGQPVRQLVRQAINFRKSA